MRFGFVGASYTARSTNVADEECINLYPESLESQGAVSPAKAYGGQTAGGRLNYFGFPGYTIFADFGDQAPVRGSWIINGRVFIAAGAKLYELASDGTFTDRGDIQNDGLAVTIVSSSIQLLIVAAGTAYCFDLATNTLTDVTASLVGTPGRVRYSDGYFIVYLVGTNKFQMSAILDGATWPGLQVNAVSVFPDNLVSIEVNHRELWVFGNRHIQPYQDTGSDNVFDVIPGTLIEKGCAATNSVCLLDNSIFWIDEDERGARMAWRSNGYTPQRISTHAVETDLSTYADISGLTAYTLQVEGHEWWVLYVPGSQWHWVYDATEGLWFKIAEWIDRQWVAHYSWNHVYAFGRHLIGDWQSGKLYAFDLNVYQNDGKVLRSLRRAPTVEDELNRVFHAEMRVNIDSGQGPQPPLVDGAGNPIAPQAMLRWSNDGGKTWGNEHWRPLGFAGEYGTFVRWQRLGYGRRRVYEFAITDPIPRAITDAYLRTS